MLLENALLPTSSSPSPITHPAHVSYLTDLLVRWISGSNNLILSNTLPLFSVSTFSRAVLGVLARSDVSLWSSKAVSRFACSVESTDIDSFVTLLDFLIETIHHYQPTRTSGQGKEKENTDAVVLRGCLQDWMNRLFVVTASASGVLADRSCCHSIVSILMLLDRCRSYGLHTLRLGASHQPFQNELPDAIATLAAHLHVAYSLADYDSRLLRLLREVSPIPTTFSQLVEHMYRNRNSAQDFMTSLQQFSTAFQIHNLLQLDVSLWNCALRIFESAPKGTSKEMETIKLLLIDTVDEAERRLFGAGALDSSPAVRLPGQSKRSSGAHYRRPSGEWEWEEMVGGWIRKTPIHAQKKQKTTHINLHESPVFIRRLLRRGAQRNSSNGATISVKSAKSALISSASKASNSRLPLSQGSDNYAKSNDSSGWDEEDEENEENVMPSSPMAERRSTLKPRHSNFSSILADAQRNRVNLHKPQPPSVSAVKKPASSSVLPKSQQSRLPLAQKRFFVPAVCLSEAALTSDDSMDLFACATSSPRA